MVFGGAVTEFSGLSTSIRKASGDVECISNTTWSMSIPDLCTSNNIQFIPKMEQERFHFGIASNKYDVYIMGGTDGKNVFKSCETYNVCQNKWKSFPELPEPISGCKAAFVDDVLYITGGLINDQVYSNKVWVCSITYYFNNFLN